MSVPHGCEGSPTTKIEIQVPESVLSVTPDPQPVLRRRGEDRGARRARDRRPRQRGHRAHRQRSSTPRTTPLPDGQRDTFELSFQVPDAAGETLAFPTIQTCEKGETGWVEVPAEGQDAEELEHPAPSFEILPASAEGDHARRGGRGRGGDELGRRGRRRARAPRRRTRTAPTCSAGPAWCWARSACWPAAPPWPGAGRPRDRATRPAWWQRALGPVRRPAGRARGGARPASTGRGARRAGRHRPRRRAPSLETAPDDGHPDLQRAGAAHRRRRSRSTTRRATRCRRLAGATSGSEVVVDLTGAADLHRRHATSSRGSCCPATATRSPVRSPSRSASASDDGRRRRPTAGHVVARGHGRCATCSRPLTLVGLLVAAGLALFVALVLPRVLARQRRPAPDPPGGARRRGGAAAAGLVLRCRWRRRTARASSWATSLTRLRPRRWSPTSCWPRPSCSLGLGVAVLSDRRRPPGPAPAAGCWPAARSRSRLAGPRSSGTPAPTSPTALLVAADALHLAGRRRLARRAGRAGADDARPRRPGAAGGLDPGPLLDPGRRCCCSRSPPPAHGPGLADPRRPGRGLVETTYGWLLLVKIALAAGRGRARRLEPLAGAARGPRRPWASATARRAAGTVHPHRGGRGGPAGGAPRRHRLPGQPVAPPGAGRGAAPGRPASGPRRVGDLSVLAVLTPRRTGRNTLLVQVQDAAGEPVRPAAPPGGRGALRRARPRRGGRSRRSAPAPTAARSCCRAPATWEVQVSMRLEPVREPGDDGQAERLDAESGGRATVSPTGTVCRKPSTRTCTNSR